MILAELIYNQECLDKYEDTGEYILPKDISSRLKSLREIDDQTVDDKRFNKSSKYVIFGVDKLDDKNHDELLEVFLNRWSNEDVNWLIGILNYPKEYTLYGIAGFKEFKLV